MSITSGVVLYAALWFLILLMTLPIGVRSQAEAGRIEPGTPAGAPENPRIGLKMIATTVLAALAWAALYWLIEGGVITHAHIRRFAPFD